MHWWVFDPSYVMWLHGHCKELRWKPIITWKCRHKEIFLNDKRNRLRDVKRKRLSAAWASWSTIHTACILFRSYCVLPAPLFNHYIGDSSGFFSRSTDHVWSHAGCRCSSLEPLCLATALAFKRWCDRLMDALRMQVRDVERAQRRIWFMGVLKHMCMIYPFMDDARQRME